VTQVIQQLETRLGVRLLQRTTRVVSPTLDGEAYYRRCLQILADVENAEGAFTGAKPGGVLRVDVQGTLARHFLLPHLPAFFAEYPGIELQMSETERWIDIVREGVDCVLRYGHLPDSELIARRVTMLERLTCASPAYLARHGTPASPDDLAGHRMIGLRSITTGDLRPLEFGAEGRVRHVAVPATISVTGTESFLATARLGLGMFQPPRFHVAQDLTAGTLVEVLTDWRPPPGPVSLLYPPTRQLSPRVRAFIDWAAGCFA
jgi:DNA-binding transcriptional LysR family regulator